MSEFSQALWHNFRANHSHVDLRDRFRQLRSIVRVYTGRPTEKMEYTVSHQAQLVYVLNAKAACSSIKRVLASKEQLLAANESVDVHSDQRLLSMMHRQVPESAAGYFGFTFVRNPYQRLVSAYLNKFKHADVTQTNFLYRNYLGGYFSLQDDFATYVRKVVLIPDVFAERHFVRQSYWLYEKNSHKLSFVGRMEVMNEQFAELAERFGLEHLPHHNKTESYDWRSFYTDELKALVAKHYHEDFSRFGYDVDGH